MIGRKGGGGGREMEDVMVDLLCYTAASGMIQFYKPDLCGGKEKNEPSARFR